MSGYESPTPDEELQQDADVTPDVAADGTPGATPDGVAASDVAEHEGGDRPAGDPAGLQDPAGTGEWASLEEGAGLRHPKTHENWHIS